MSSDTQHILDQRYDNVLEVRFNRPEKKNAITPEMYQRLDVLLLDASKDSSIHVIYLRGSEGCFSAGNDVADLARGMRTSAGGAGNFMSTVIAMDKPIVAAVSGAAIGIGATMLFHCDLIYADESALLVTPFTRLGVCPEAGASYALPARIGAVRAADMLLRNTPVNAQEALHMGLINAVLPKKTLYDEAKKIAVELAGLPAQSVQYTKKLMRREYASKSQDAFEAEMEGFKDLLESPDAKKAFAAFLNK